MEKWENPEMPHELHWRLQVAFHNGNKEEINRLNTIWFSEVDERVRTELREYSNI